MPTETKTETVTFYSQLPGAVLIKDPEDYELNHRGQRIKRFAPVHVEFGADGGDPHLFTTDDPEIIEWLRNHDKFEVLERGFWELGNAPNEPKPSLQSQIEAITKAAARGDAEGIKAVIEVEDSTHKRSVVYDAARGAIAGLEAVEGDIEETPSFSAPSNLDSTPSQD